MGGMRQEWLVQFDGFRFSGGRRGVLRIRAARYGDGTPALQVDGEDGPERVLTVAVPGEVLQDDELILRWACEGGLIGPRPYDSGQLGDREMGGLIAALQLFTPPRRTIDLGFVPSYAAVVKLSRCVRRGRRHADVPVIACSGCREDVEREVLARLERRAAAESVKILGEMARRAR